MISREDFVFTIGYDGPAAVVDGQAKRRCGALSTAALAEAGLFRAAYSSALYSGDAAEMALVIDAYNALTGSSYKPTDSLERLFGVFRVEEARRSIVL